MPIKGLTDRELSFPEIGQIRKGAPKSERAPGKDLDYFRVTFDEAEREAETTFRQIYGDRPQEIRIILPFNELERMWDAWLEAYTAGRLVARSDGERYIYKVDTKTGEIQVKNGQPHSPYIEGQPAGADYRNNPVYCKPVGRLKVILPELARAAYMTVLTTSVHDIANISKQLEAFKRLNNEQIAGIPLVLRRRPKKISMPKDGGQRVRVTKWMLSIEADPTWVKAKLTEVKRLALPGNGLALLPEGEHEAVVEIETGPEENDFTDPGEDDDYIDVEYHEEEETEPEPQRAVTYPAGRPYDPETLKGKLAEYAGRLTDPTVSEQQRGLMRHALDLCFTGESDAESKRHDVLHWLTGQSSSKAVPAAFVKAILNGWLRPEKDSGGLYHVEPACVREAHAIYTHILKAEGQQTLL